MIKKYLPLSPDDMEHLRRGGKPQRDGSSATDLVRAERLREAFEALREVNKLVPVIVEGKKDAAALRKLGLVGDIVTLHAGKTLYDFSEDISERYSTVVLLLDWDTKGESLHQELGRSLKGRWEEFSAFRDMIRILCQKDVKDVEGIPRLLERLEGPWGAPPEGGPR